MPQATTAELVREMYRAYGTGDAPAIERIIHDDIDWIIHGPVGVFPFEGPRQGKAAVLQVLAEIAKDYALQAYDPEVVVVENDRAAVMSNVAFTQRTTGRLLRLRVAHFLRFRDGRLVEFREFMDSFDAVEQALGTWIDVGKPVAV